jgi:hypothetical protein
VAEITHEQQMQELELRRVMYEELSHQRDLAAYAVLGAARVLFRMVSDPDMAKSGLNAIAEYDRRNQALSAFEIAAPGEVK